MRLLRSRWFWAAVLLGLGAVVLWSFLVPPAQARLRVDYYYLPGCSICADARLDLSGVEEEFSGTVRLSSVDVTGSRDIARELGFKTHGVVIRSMDESVLWTQRDHQVDVQSVRQAVRHYLAQYPVGD